MVLGRDGKRPKWVVESKLIRDMMVLGMTVKLPYGVVESRLEAPGVCPGHDIEYRKAHLSHEVTNVVPGKTVKRPTGR